MNLHQLKLFEAVVRHLNITQASAALHISQPSVSQQLRLLEDEFGTRFFIRLNQGVQLTAEGEEFFKAIRPLLATVENLEQKFKRKAKANDTAPLVVGGSHNVSTSILPKLLMALKERHKSVQFVLETNESRIIETRLLNAELEIALITNSSHRSELVYEPYQEMELVAFCLPRNPLAHKKLTLKELSECPLVLKGGSRLEKALMNLGYRMNVVLRCEESSTVRSAVRMGMGVGISYRNAIAGRIATGNLKVLNVPELKQMKIKSFGVYDKRRPLAPMAQEFLRILREKRNLPIAVKIVQLSSARTLLDH